MKKRVEVFQAFFHLPTMEKIYTEVPCVVSVKPSVYVDGHLFVASHVLCFAGTDRFTFVWPMSHVARLVAVSVTPSKGCSQTVGDREQTRDPSCFTYLSFRKGYAHHQSASPLQSAAKVIAMNARLP